MKHLFISLLLLISITVSAFSKDEPIPSSAIRSFQKAFSDAKDVKWSEASELFKVDFFLNNQFVNAYYNNSGSLVALTKNILSTQLPLILEKSLKEKYDDYWITDLLEVYKDGEVYYYVALENPDTKLYLRSSTNSWELSRKNSK